MPSNIEKREKVVTKRFDEDQAGRDVGFVTVEKSGAQRSKTLDTIVDVTLRVTRIGKNGAFCGYTECPDIEDDKKVVFGDNVSGFEKLTSVKVMLHPELVPQHAARDGLVTIGTRDKGIEADRTIAEYSLSEGLADDDWLVGKDTILDALKTGLEGQDMQRFYPLLYYLLNNALLRNNQYQTLVDDAADKCYADKDMADMTQAQLLRAMEITSIFDAIAVEDEEMLENLTVFSAVPASRISKAFKKSREQVYEYENAAREAAERLYLPGLTYEPIGQVAGGRSWPYMDATLKPEDEGSFGRELAALEEKNVTPVTRELQRELDEVRRRSDYARTSHIMHTVLLDAEQATSDNG